MLLNVKCADYVLLVTEPTKTGLHDLLRLIELLKLLKIPSGIFVNKFDLNFRIFKDIKNYSQRENISFTGKLKFDESIVQGLRDGENLVETNNYNEEIFKKVISAIKNQLPSWNSNSENLKLKIKGRARWKL